MEAKPLIVVLCLDNEPVSDVINNHLYTALAKEDVVRKARTLPEARRYLTSTTRPHAILVVDAAVTYPENREVLLRLVEYAQAGGTVVYAGVFSSMVRYPDLESMFKDVWDLPWRASAYTNGTYTVNTRVGRMNTTGLAKRYSVKATLVNNVAYDHAVYLSSSSLKKLRKDGGPLAGQTYQTPAAFAAIGRGRVGYIGDVNGVSDTTRLVIAMCFWPGSRAPISPGHGVAEIVSLLSPAYILLLLTRASCTPGQHLCKRTSHIAPQHLWQPKLKSAPFSSSLWRRSHIQTRSTPSSTVPYARERTSLKSKSPALP